MVKRPSRVLHLGQKFARRALSFLISHKLFLQFLIAETAGILARGALEAVRGGGEAARSSLEAARRVLAAARGGSEAPQGALEVARRALEDVRWALAVVGVARGSQAMRMEREVRMARMACEDVGIEDTGGVVEDVGRAVGSAGEVLDRMMEAYEILAALSPFLDTRIVAVDCTSRTVDTVFALHRNHIPVGTADMG